MPVLAALAPALIGAAGAVGGALIGSHATNSAADAQLQASQANNALQEKLYNENTANLSPFLSTGASASGALASILGLNGGPSQQGAFSNWQDAMGFQNQLKTGVDALQSGEALSGILHSGKTLKDTLTYGQTQAQSSLDDFMGHLQSQAGLGLSAGAAIAGVGENYGSQVSANNNNAAAAQGNAALASGSLWGKALSSGAGALGQAFSNSSYGAGSGAFSGTYAPGTVGAGASIPPELVGAW